MNRTGMLGNIFEKDWRTVFEITGCDSRNSHKYYIPMLKRSKLSKMPPFIYSNIWNCNENHFSDYHNIDFCLV